MNFDDLYVWLIPQLPNGIALRLAKRLIWKNDREKNKSIFGHYLAFVLLQLWGEVKVFKKRRPRWIGRKRLTLFRPMLLEVEYESRIRLRSASPV